MSDNEEIRSVADSAVPNAGRIYDYILGGNYNYEVDRKIADDLMQRMPVFKKMTKIIRWFLGNMVDRAFQTGFTQILDFASGLPTVDHIHTRIPEEIKDKVKIVYSDIDPVTVQIGKRKIKKDMGDSKSVKFVECDCRKPEVLLESDEIINFFDKNQKVAIGLSGVLYFLSDEDINHTTNILYEWAPEGSIIYFCDFSTDSENIKDNEILQLTIKYYKEIKQPFYFRTQEKLKELIKPWKIKDPGFQKLEKWIKISMNITDELINKKGGAAYGGILEK